MAKASMLTRGGKSAPSTVVLRAHDSNKPTDPQSYGVVTPPQQRDRLNVPAPAPGAAPAPAASAAKPCGGCGGCK